MADNSSSGSLYVVATPIGNLEDLTYRAEIVLKSVQIIAAEDTRRAAVLLARIDHRAPDLLSLHEHNEAAVTPKLLTRLAAGEDVAVISDAGTPLVNDPGYNLVAEAHKAGIKTIPIPGASSITALLSICPLPCQPFQFVGFLPAKAGARSTKIEQMVASGAASVFLESPKRIHATLKAFEETKTERPLMIGRELTKKFETTYVGTAQELLLKLESEPKGELTVVLAADATVVRGLDESHVMRALLKELSPTQAARLGAAICGVKKSAMYNLALSMTEE